MTCMARVTTTFDISALPVFVCRRCAPCIVHPDVEQNLLMATNIDSRVLWKQPEAAITAVEMMKMLRERCENIEKKITCYS